MYPISEPRVGGKIYSASLLFNKLQEFGLQDNDVPNLEEIKEDGKQFTGGGNKEPEKYVITDEIFSFF